MKRSLQVFLLLFGLTCLVISLLHIAHGPKVIPGSIPVNATMDSEDRFYATLFLGFAFAVLWCIPGIERKSGLVYFLAFIFFLGGIARLVSMAAVGLPGGFFIAMTVLELLIPFVMVYVQWRVSRDAYA